MSLRSRGRSGASILSVALALSPAAAAAQIVAPPSNSLVVDPQQGATPRPITPAPLPSTPATTLPPLDAPVPTPPQQPPPAIPLQSLRGEMPDAGVRAQPLPAPREGALPTPSRDPLALDPKSDPILRLAIASADPSAFRDAIRGVVARNPNAAEALARTDEAEAVRNEARAAQYPVLDLSFSHFRVLDRAFSNDPQNVLERSRPSQRTDAIARVQQSVIDFGTARNRIAAGNRRIEASVAAMDDATTQVALRGIAVWYQVFGYRALVSLSTAFVDSQTQLRSAIEQRVQQGYAAPGDVAQVESYIAAAQAQLANYRRQLSSAEAQYQALTGMPAPAGFGRAPAADMPVVSQERARQDAEAVPAVRYARAAAEAARFDVKTAKANALPGVSVGVDAGRYGVFETQKDFDIRGTVTLAARLGGGAKQRVDASAARARGAEATYERIRQDAVRDAAIAWADVDALEASEAAIRDNYLATRQSRDVLAERFRVSRGTLFDLLGAEANYFNVAARYVETVTELDIARYSLLARRGKLLDAFGIEPARLDR
ncbi:TolC family protein [Sphingomonas floccifaciens]|uniref:TolC family protein n=1 Tax=Sphingomonas floccifaciens TaxID=1844115 RepID=A0ABW4NKB1_9SPHN